MRDGPEVNQPIIVRRFDRTNKCWLPPSKGTVRKKQTITGVLTVFESYTVGLMNANNREYTLDFSSMLGEIANKKGEFPQLTAQQAANNDLAHRVSGDKFLIHPLVGPMKHLELSVNRTRVLPWNSSTLPALVNARHDVLDEYGNFMPQLG
ncbi:hypothetical protein HWV62_12894 [Athelia sp. TMB]|nr:hypothetical protein HWV62_21700 [Athelia sp. TMB]KAF7984649.1 hypothetical protein HWV62_12894 [Athelia sp. TMB]